MRFEGTTYWPWPMAVAATGDPELAQQQGRAIGEEARALGINQIAAPVADVNLDPDNPIINVRSYGEDPQDVARFVVAFVRGVQSAGVLATVKHFPGHGDTHTDSHRSRRSSLPLASASSKWSSSHFARPSPGRARRDDGASASRRSTRRRPLPRPDGHGETPTRGMPSTSRTTLRCRRPCLRP
jgi:hypothetical protein